MLPLIVMFPNIWIRIYPIQAQDEKPPIWHVSTLFRHHNQPQVISHFKVVGSCLLNIYHKNYCVVTTVKPEWSQLQIWLKINVHRDSNRRRNTDSYRSVVEMWRSPNGLGCRGATGGQGATSITFHQEFTLISVKRGDKPCRWWDLRPG